MKKFCANLQFLASIVAAALPATLPADLLRNRLDVAADMENLHAAVAGIGYAASTLVDVWQAFAGPDTPSQAESHQPQETNQK